MSVIAQNLQLIKQKINQTAQNYSHNPALTNLVAVSKNIDQSQIIQAINLGCKIFGENRVDEAKKKWPDIKNQHPEIKLHLIGHLQSNKAGDAVKIFDCIQSLDSEKLALILKDEMTKQNKFPEIYVQINIGEEPQKSGIDPLLANQFIQKVINEYKLPVSGVMGIAPLNQDPTLYFALLKKIADDNNLKNISMGMSSDFEIAIALGANFIRLGSAIFGTRNIN